MKSWLRWFRSSKEESQEEGPPIPNPLATSSQNTQEAISDPNDYFETLVATLAKGEVVEALCSPPFWTQWRRLVAQGDERLGIQWLAKILQWDTLSPAQKNEIRHTIALTHHERGEGELAISYLEALTHEENYAEGALYRLGDIHHDAGRQSKALHYYERVYARDANAPNIRNKLARLHGALGKRQVDHGATLQGAAELTHDSRYQIKYELGRGAAGVVYLALDQELQREVAVKLLHPHLAASKQANACARFFDEARLAASLRHPNVVAILDLNESMRQLVMERCLGGTLRDHLKHVGTLKIRHALERHAQILSALVAAHQGGIVHRDLKPSNLMFRRKPSEPGCEIVLGDFGVAHLPNQDGQTAEDIGGKQQRLDASPKPQTQRLIGTLSYMAPEQRQGDAGPASDVYAAALVLFEMLTGRLPWEQEILLSGTRRPDDLMLPISLAPKNKALTMALQEHLFEISHPDPTKRSKSTDAWAGAKRLRAQAIAMS